MDKPSSTRLLAIPHDGRVDMTPTPRERTNAIILFTPSHDIYRICILHPPLGLVSRQIIMTTKNEEFKDELINPPPAMNVDNFEQQNNHHN